MAYGMQRCTFVNSPFKFGPVDREQELNLNSRTIKNGIIVKGLQWTSCHVGCDLVLKLSLVLITEDVLKEGYSTEK